MKPRMNRSPGDLLLIGGNEDKVGDREILRLLFQEAGGAKGRIEIITTASSEPGKLGPLYENVFREMGAGYAKSMHVGARPEADNPAFVDRIGKATALLFTGGSQLRITSQLEATPVAEAIRAHFFERGGLVAGTSAGAAALTGTIIYEGDSPVALHKGTVKMTGGFGLVLDCVVDTHFISRGRIGRLMQVVVSNPRLIGIGIGEDTGVLIKKGTTFRVVGTGLVFVVDGQDIAFTNVTEVRELEPFSVENVKVHVLAAGAGFDLATRSFLPPPKRKPDRKASDSR